MALVPIFVKTLSKGKVIALLLFASLVLAYITLPRVIVNYAKEGTQEVRYIWNTQHRIDRGSLLPGEGTADIGHTFPDKDFFMVFFWRTATGSQRCIDITPQWGKTIEIFLDATGRIDTTKTTPEVMARLRHCEGEPDPFRQ